MKRLIYLTIISALLSETIPSIDLGWFHLSIFRVSFILMSLVYFLEVFKTRKFDRVIETFTKLNYSLCFMIIWLLIAIISVLWVNDYLSWLKAVYFISIGTFSALIFTKYLEDISDITIILRLITPVILIHNLLGWSEIITGNYFFLVDNRFERYIRYRHPVSIFGNTNDFALLLMFALFFSLINLNCKIKLEN